MLVVVPVDPPRDGLVLRSLLEETPLSPADARRLYEASVADVVRAVAASGGDLLVNYRDEETLPAEHADEAGAEPEAAVRALVADALGGTEDVRFERQVGSTRTARIGNTVTHLLEREEQTSVGVLEPTVPLVARTEVDNAAMTIRRNDVVLGPSTGGSTYLAAFSEPIDFADVDATPELATVAERADDEGRPVGFVPMLPMISSEVGLCSTIAQIRARRVADRPVPAATAGVLEELGVVVEDGPAIGLEGDR